AASLSPVAPGTLQLSSSDAVAKELGAATTLLGSSTFAPGNAGPPDPTKAIQSFNLLQTVTPQSTTESTKGVLGASATPFGLEPNITLDERADYISHLHRLRRINLGDDNADSAGYSLYLMRVPISIQPGDKTRQGFGAIANMTVRHDFGPRFLPA